MRVLSLLAVGAFVLACAQPRQATPRSRVAVPASLPSPHVDFATQIQSILTARCQPCHFAGGKMYASLPFDRAETTLRLREKLFTRLKDENERRTIRQFLAEHPARSTAAP